MLEKRTFIASEAEHEAVQALLAKHPGPASVTYELPGEDGPLLVDVGSRTFRVHSDGSTEDSRS